MGMFTLKLKDCSQWAGLLTEEGTLEGLGMMILDFRTHWRKLVAHSGEKPFPVIGAHSAVASTVEKNQTNLLLGKQFKETFKDPQWRKVKQMQPMQLCLLSGKWFEETFKDAQWWKVKQMQPMRLCLLSGKWFEETFKDAQWRKVKQMQPMQVYLLSSLRQAIWQDV